MNKKTIAGIGAGSAILIAAVLLGLTLSGAALPSQNLGPSPSQTSQTFNMSNSTNGQALNGGANNSATQITAPTGSTLTFSNLTGHWVGLAGNSSGKSSGTFAFTVTNSTDGDLVLTLKSGSFTINGTTYSASSGNVTLNEGSRSGFGSGAASGGSAFDIHLAGIHGQSGTMAFIGAIKLDVKLGTTDYIVILGNS